MSRHRDEQVALALGMLPPEQAQALRARLAADPEAGADLAADEAALAALLDDLDLSAVQMPQDAGERLLARVQTERASEEGARRTLPPTPAKRAPNPRPTGWGLPFAASLLVGAALALVLRVPADLPARYARVPGAAQQSIATPGGSLGTLTRLPDGRTFVYLTRPLEPGRAYQLWSLAGEQPRSLGVFTQGGLLTLPLPPGTPLAVTVEPPGGSAAPTTKPLFAQAL
ncbi:MAG: anti-sigma factor [Deinococcus sp.]|uniref:anti-sigma factor n=1 Tax=Deinococcus sp. TaxID=47478 RepID=UPI0026DC5F04|nr:anti-sigma factor [Deinococcus sp.]MDO4244784.1 anti-sigma factor [Deinococcus sp.]